MISISLEITLPCGCVAKHSVIHEYDPTPPDPGFMKVDFDKGESMPPDELIKRFGEHSVKVLEFWYRTRFIKEDRHRCELVSDTNPLGLLPKEPKQ